MNRKMLEKIRNVVLARPAPNEWRRGQIEGVVECGADEFVAKCAYEETVDFLLVADAEMEPLIDEVYRLRAIARTLGLVVGIPKDELNSLLDGDDP